MNKCNEENRQEAELWTTGEKLVRKEGRSPQVAKSSAQDPETLRMGEKARAWGEGLGQGQAIKRGLNFMLNLLRSSC